MSQGTIIVTKRDRRVIGGAGVVTGRDIAWLSNTSAIHMPMPFYAGGACGGSQYNSLIE